MKVLTLHQPWASLIATGLKWVETRPNATNVRGRIAIHAAARRVSVEDVWTFWPVLRDRGGYETERQIVLGAIVATANLVDCVPMIEPHEVANERPVLAVADHLTLWHRGMPGWPYERGTVLDDQLPFGHFAPGRYAWLLDDVHAVTDWCPACEGVGNVPAIAPDGARWNRVCEACDGKGALSGPVPFRGGQGWSRRWEPIS